MKKTIKSIVGFIRANIAHFRNFGINSYIGKRCNIKGGLYIQIGSNVTIRPDVDIWASGKGIIIQDGSEIGQRTRISITNSLVIEKDVLISPNVYITDCDHQYQDITKAVIRQGVIDSENTVCIGEGSYIGINSVIVGNVRIGKHCVIGANSVVSKNIPDYCVVVGAPAKIIKRYSLSGEKWINE